MARICIAEDDADLRQVLTFALAEQGHEVSVAENGEIAIEVVEERRPDLLILDLMMPKLDGYQVLENLATRELRGDTRVLILTARGSESDREKGLALGGDEYLTKPFQVQELLDTINRLLTESPEKVRGRREAELDKAKLLSNLESLLGDDPEPSK